MNASITPSLSSPPDLTHSRSSSFHTSSISGADTALPDLAHFEDISLTKESLLGGKNGRSNGSRKRFLPLTGGGSSDGTTVASRELTLGDKRQFPQSCCGQGNKTLGLGSAYALNMPVGPTPSRKFSTSSRLARRAMSNHSRSRSPSPSPLAAPFPPISPHSTNLAPEPQPIFTPVRASTSRRGSWQPNRKSTKELEEEYDDMDEDLPDDASLWNVPLSPRLACREMAIPSSTSAAKSPSKTPPPWESDAATPAALKLATTVSATKMSPCSLSSAPEFPQKGGDSRCLSTHVAREHYPLSKGRAKSWTVAMSELSEDAQQLTEALESLAGSATGLRVSSKLKTSSIDLQRTKTSVDLPPLKTNNVMIDPLPISKEKEKVLSRTRPSWLPPKSQKEERKHLKEYQQMMELSLQAEKRKAANNASVQCAKDDIKNAFQRIWEEHVLPDWDRLIREPRTRELWWRGIAPGSRAEVWERAIGNDLALTVATYTKALQRSQDVEAQIFSEGKNEHRKERTWFNAIRRDVKATLPELNIFQPGRPLHEHLTKVLMAYSMYRSDVGYSHGTHLLAAMLVLTYHSPSRAFLPLCNLLNRPLPLAFLTGDPSATGKAYALTLALLLSKLPRLHDRLFRPPPSGLGLSAHEVLEPMMRTLFLGPGKGLGVETAARVWDVMVFDGDAVIIRTAVAVLSAVEGSLYGDRQEVLNKLGWRGDWHVGGEDEFMARVRNAGKEDKRRPQ